MREEGHSVRAMARLLGRAPSSIGRELNRNGPEGLGYDAARAGVLAQRRRFQPRRRRKLAPESVLLGVVEHYLREGWSPEQIAGALKGLYPETVEKRVSHETIYRALYVLPRGELRRELLACLRQGRGGAAAPIARGRPARPDRRCGECS